MIRLRSFPERDIWTASFRHATQMGSTFADAVRLADAVVLKERQVAA